MGRIRTIKPEFHAHEELSALPAETHLLAAALVNYADDEGYFNANPLLVKAGTTPLRLDKTKIEEQMAQLEAIGYIEVRRDGVKQYGCIVTFGVHQKVQHPAKSKIKPKFESLMKSSRSSHEVLTPEQGTGNGEQGTGNREQGIKVSLASQAHPDASRGASEIHPDFAIYQAYPRKEGKGAALEAIRKAVIRLVKGEAPHPPMAKLDAQRYLMRRVLEYERSPAGRQPDKTKIPHPATWFNQKRYDDDQVNWQLVNGAGNGTYQSKSESSFDALKRSLEAGRNQSAADEVGGAEASEDRGAGVRGFLGGPDGVRPEGHSSSHRILSGS